MHTASGDARQTAAAAVPQAQMPCWKLQRNFWGGVKQQSRNTRKRGRAGDAEQAATPGKTVAAA